MFHSQCIVDDFLKIAGQVVSGGNPGQFRFHLFATVTIVPRPLVEGTRHACGNLRVEGVKLDHTIRMQALTGTVCGVESRWVHHGENTQH